MAAWVRFVSLSVRRGPLRFRCRVAGDLRHQKPNRLRELVRIVGQHGRNLRLGCHLTWINKIKNGSPHAAELRDECPRISVTSGRQTSRTLPSTGTARPLQRHACAFWQTTYPCHTRWAKLMLGSFNSTASEGQ